MACYSFTLTIPVICCPSHNFEIILSIMNWTWFWSTQHLTTFDRKMWIADVLVFSVEAFEAFTSFVISWLTNWWPREPFSALKGKSVESHYFETRFTSSLQIGSFSSDDWNDWLGGQEQAQRNSEGNASKFTASGSDEELGMARAETRLPMETLAQ